MYQDNGWSELPTFGELHDAVIQILEKHLVFKKAKILTIVPVELEMENETTFANRPLPSRASTFWTLQGDHETWRWNGTSSSKSHTLRLVSRIFSSCRCNWWIITDDEVLHTACTCRSGSKQREPVIITRWPTQITFTSGWTTVTMTEKVLARCLWHERDQTVTYFVKKWVYTKHWIKACFLNVQGCVRYLGALSETILFPSARVPWAPDLVLRDEPYRLFFRSRSGLWGNHFQSKLVFARKRKDPVGLVNYQGSQTEMKPKHFLNFWRLRETSVAAQVKQVQTNQKKHCKNPSWPS